MIEPPHRCTQVALGVRQKQPNTRDPHPLARGMQPPTSATTGTHHCHTQLWAGGFRALFNALEGAATLDHHQQLKANTTKGEILVLGGWGIWKK